MQLLGSQKDMATIGLAGFVHPKMIDAAREAAGSVGAQNGGGVTENVEVEVNLLARLPSAREQVGGQAVLGRQSAYATPWLTEGHGYDRTCGFCPPQND